MNQPIFGIKESELNSLNLEILDYADKISELFDKINSNMDKLPSHYQGPSCVELIRKYQELSISFDLISNNIRSYSDDLTALIQKIRESDGQIAALIDEHTKNQLKAPRL